MDPQTIAACVPGCETLEPEAEDRYLIVLTAGVAAVSGTFGGTVQIADKRPPHSYRLIVDGVGRPGFAKGEARISLAASGDDVLVDVAGTVEIGGLVAQVGQRLLGATAKMMMDRFFKCARSKVK